MDYQKHTATDFALDESFRLWVTAPDRQSRGFWEAWLSQNPGKEPEIAEARKLVRSLKFKDDVLSDERRADLERRIFKSIRTAETAPQPRRVRWAAQYRAAGWMRAAAILVAGVLGVWGILFWRSHRPTEYATEYGQTLVLTLPDQSKVVLNANSILRFYPDWHSGSLREVWLKGEAFFEVTRQPARTHAAKFKVYTEDLTVEVLGTKFNVAEHGENTAVVLNEGSVKLDLKAGQTSRNLLMRPGERVSYSEKDRTVRKSVVKAANYSAWTQHHWVLENTALAEVVARIETTYGVKVVVENEAMLRERITGVLPIKDMASLLEVLSVTYNIQITESEGQLNITR